MPLLVFAGLGSVVRAMACRAFVGLGLWVECHCVRLQAYRHELKAISCACGIQVMGSVLFHALVGLEGHRCNGISRVRGIRVIVFLQFHSLVELGSWV